MLHEGLWRIDVHDVCTKPVTRSNQRRDMRILPVDADSSLRIIAVS